MANQSEQDEQFFSINASTGDWVSTNPLSHEQACVIAASVMPGWTPEKVHALYDSKPKTKPADVLGGLFIITIFFCAIALLIGGTYKVFTLWF